MPLCSTCSALTLESLIQKSGYQLADSLNTVRQRAVSCELCKLIEDSLRVIPLPSPSVKKDPAVWASGVPTTSPPTTKALNGVVVACNGRSVTFDLYGKPPLADSINGQAISPQINAAQVAAFVRAKEAICKEPSHERCQKTLSGGDLDPYYRPPCLWNVETNMLVENPLEMQSSPYTALSYTWGESGAVLPSRLLIANKEARLQGQMLPDTFLQVYKQAFEITKELGVRFIWIDALCILQDRDEPKAKADRENNFNNHVHKIYQNARVTICAIFKEPSDNPLEMRKVPGVGEVVDVVDGKYCIAKRLGSPPVDIGVESPQGRPFWATRGWTFQERVLATSCIYLTKHQLYWECHTSLVEERGKSHPPVVYKRSMSQLQGFWPSMVRDYSSRDLGYVGDKIPAITGITKEISGDPSNDFLKVGFMPNRVGRDILWESGEIKGLKRRKDRNNKLVETPPSWSWAYWNGFIDFESYLDTATLSSATYSLLPFDILLIEGAEYFELQAGNVTLNDIGGPTDIVYSVRHDNLKILKKLDEDSNTVGWGAFDVDPFRDGADTNEKNVVCVLISTTSWTDTTKPNDTQKAANVLLLNRLPLSPNVFGRAGVGQIWDSQSVTWKNDLAKISIAALEKPDPKL